MRSSAVALTLLLCASVLAHVGGGLTDLHIGFYVLLVVVALYQSWAPFLTAIGFVAVHHSLMALVAPDAVVSASHAQDSPLPTPRCTPGFLLAQAVALAFGGKFTELAEAARVADAGRARQERTHHQGLLAGEREDEVRRATLRLEHNEARAADLAQRMVGVEGAGQVLNQEVATATAVLDELRASIGSIAAAAATRPGPRWTPTPRSPWTPSPGCPRP